MLLRFVITGVALSVVTATAYSGAFAAGNFRLIEAKAGAERILDDALHPTQFGNESDVNGDGTVDILDYQQHVDDSARAQHSEEIPSNTFPPASKLPDDHRITVPLVCGTLAAYLANGAESAGEKSIVILDASAIRLERLHQNRYSLSPHAPTVRL